VDASQVDFTAPYPGAVCRSLADKLAETVSITDFGAVRDGSRAQNQAAIEAAIAAISDYGDTPGTVQRHVLHVPAGRWRFSDQIKIGSNLHIIGANKGATIFDFPGMDKPCLSLKGAYNADVNGILVRNQSPVPGSVGVDMTDTYMCDVSKMIVQDVDIGVWLYGGSFGAYYNEISRVVVSGANRVGFLIDSVEPYSNVNANKLFACQAHHSEICFAILSGNNNSLYDPNAEVEAYRERLILIDKSQDLSIYNPRAEKGGTGGPANVGIDITANARNTLIAGGNIQNVNQTIRDAGQGTIKIMGNFTPPPPAVNGPARYWGVVKKNAPAGGSYHTEMQVEDANGLVPVAYPMMYSQALSLNGVNWARLIDGDLNTPAFHTDNAIIGAYFRLDFGAPVDLKKWRFYVNGNVPCIWDVVKSADGVNWQPVATGLNCAGGAGWKEISW
jgi:hypothetical protein